VAAANPGRISSFSLQPLHALFGAQVTGIDLTSTPSDAVMEEVIAALDEYSVLVFSDQVLSNEQHVAFSERFGPLEIMLKGSAGDGSPFAGITNVDPDTNEIFAADDHRMQRNYSNELWHTDSSFKAVSAWVSILHAKEVPPVGGETSFVSLRRAWDELTPMLQAQCAPLAVEHDFVYSRSILNDKTFLTDEQKAEVPPVPQRLVLTNPRNGRKSLYLGSHAARIIGWPEPRGRELLDMLTEHATREPCIYSHRWRANQLVMWDDRATMHHGGGWDYQRYRRVMARTTVSGVTPTISGSELTSARDAAARQS
jgi:alpha-ketoglutarate-dependent 2,4-dichlorophenoxyacetate dioxygenase